VELHPLVLEKPVHQRYYIRHHKCVFEHLLIYAKNKETVKIEKKADSLPNIKITDKYTATRDKMVENVPDKYQKVFEYALMVPDIISLMYRLFKDKRVKLDVKIKVAGILAYLASPIDIMPDFIPMVGKVDDVAIAFFGLNSIINEIPEEIILQNWQGKENLIVTVREAVNYISVAVGGENVSKLLHAMGKVLKRKGVKKDGIEVSARKTKRDKKKKSKREDDEEKKVGL
ncbi:MAG TPA: DUF1232 domain-containing protein, partial [Clostridiaceae bacterium]|nr:DUF1232 domain-containing protein [Clostridiaceae bacterium]